MILSSPLPILIEYKCLNTKITGRAIWRMRPALRHRDRVREISFEGSNAGFKKFFRATKCSFPVLESLSLFFPKTTTNRKLYILRGPELSDLHLGLPFPRAHVRIFVVRNGSHRPRVDARDRHRAINRNDPSRLSSRNALPVQSRCIHNGRTPRPPVAAFGPQRYSHNARINTFPLHWPEHILE